MHVRGHGHYSKYSWSPHSAQFDNYYAINSQTEVVYGLITYSIWASSMHYIQRFLSQCTELWNKIMTYLTVSNAEHKSTIFWEQKLHNMVPYIIPHHVSCVSYFHLFFESMQISNLSVVYKEPICVPLRSYYISYTFIQVNFSETRKYAQPSK